MNFEILTYLLVVICFFVVVAAIGLAIAGNEMRKEIIRLQKHLDHAFFIEDFEDVKKFSQQLSKIDSEVYRQFAAKFTGEIIRQRPNAWYEYIRDKHCFEITTDLSHGN